MIVVLPLLNDAACLQLMPKPFHFGADFNPQQAMINSAKIGNPRRYRTEQRKLRVLQRRIARRTSGESNRRKAVHQRQHERIANRRKDSINKVVHRLIQQYNRIALEDLRISNMIKNRHLAKSILDEKWAIVERLQAKAGYALSAAGWVPGRSQAYIEDLNVDMCLKT